MGCENIAFCTVDFKDLYGVGITLLSQSWVVRLFSYTLAWFHFSFSFLRQHFMQPRLPQTPYELYGQG